MTWSRAVETTHPGGRTREVAYIRCDGDRDCPSWEAVGLHGGDVLKIQRLLVRRGWTWTDVADGARDLCPQHTPCGHEHPDRPGWVCAIHGPHEAGRHYYVKEPTS